MKCSFFQAAIVLILLYGCTTWMLTKQLEKKLDSNYTRMLRAILNKSWREHPTRHQLYGHLPPIMKTIQVRRTRHAGHCWRNRDELISDVLLWTATHGRAKAGRPAWTYIQQLCKDTECSPEDQPEAMNDREKWRERVKDIRAGSTTWWGWWLVGWVLWHINLCRLFNAKSIFIQFSQTVLIQTIQFSISMQFYLTHRKSPIRCYHSRPEWTWEQWQWRGALHSPKPQHHWNLTIRLFSVISGHSLGRSYPYAEKQSVYSTAPADWARAILWSKVITPQCQISFFLIRFSFFSIQYQML